MTDYIDRAELKARLEDFSKWCRDGRKQGVDFVLDCPLPDIPTADVVPRSEVEKADQEIERLEHILNSYALQYGTVTDKQKVIDQAKQDVAREIFEEIVKLLIFNTYEIACISKNDLAELKKKYIGE